MRPATGEEVTVVFDRRPPDVPPGAHGAAQVVFATRRGRNAADHEIVRIVAEDPAPVPSASSPPTGGWSSVFGN